MSILCNWLWERHVLFCFHMCLVNTCSICACRHHTKESPSPGAWILSVTIILTEVRKTSTQNKKLYFSSQHSTPFPLKTNNTKTLKVIIPKRQFHVIFFSFLLIYIQSSLSILRGLLQDPCRYQNPQMFKSLIYTD